MHRLVRGAFWSCSYAAWRLDAGFILAVFVVGRKQFCIVDLPITIINDV
jgi:hypothetical protein